MQRNRRRHGEMLPPIRVAVQWAADLAFDLRQATHSQSSVTEPRAVPRWERPPLGWIKCNTDGAFYKQTGQGATGTVLRDGAGAFIRGSAKWYDHCLDALTMEAIISLFACSYTIVDYKLEQYFSLTPNQSTVNNPRSFTTCRTD